MKPRIVTVCILGLGTVGAGVYELLRTRASAIKAATGLDIRIAGVCEKNRALLRKLRVPAKLVIADIDAAAIRADIAVELIGGTGVAGRVVKRALSAGKYVVTANKALLAERGRELYTLARRRQTDICCEAAVAGGIPIIKAIREGLAVNRITEIYGIINGTTNYILTRMERDAMSFDQALAAAQDRGFAEKPDPSLDIDGIDSGHKAVILANLVSGSHYRFRDMYIEGIRRITLQDIRYALEMGFRIKLIATVRKVSGTLDVRVHPALVPLSHPLAGIANEYNGVFVKADAVGEQLYYGKGAGKMPTASAVIADIIDCAKRLTSGESPVFAGLARSKSVPVFAIHEISCSYFLKFVTSDQPLVLAKIARILGQHEISITSVIQKDINTAVPGAKPRGVPIVIITHRAKENQVQAALKEIDRLNVIKAKSSLIRILE